MMRLRHVCWAVLAFLVSVNDVFADQRFRVSVVSANVRFEPSITSAIIARVDRGTVLRVIAIEGAWVKVALPAPGNLERVGYIASTLGTVEEIPGLAPPSPASSTPSPGPTPRTGPPPSAPLETPAQPAGDSPEVKETSPRADSAPPAPAQPAFAIPFRSSRRTYVFPIFFGKWLDGYYDALSFGAGVGRSLSDRVDVLADVGYGKYAGGYELSSGFIQESSSFLLVSGNIVYNFSPFAERFVPFTGGGLLWVRSVQGGSAQTRPFPFRFPGSAETLVTAQALGGVQFAFRTRWSVRGEGRFHFFAEDGTLASLSFLGGVVFCPGCED